MIAGFLSRSKAAAAAIQDLAATKIAAAPLTPPPTTIAAVEIPTMTAAVPRLHMIALVAMMITIAADLTATIAAVLAAAMIATAEGATAVAATTGTTKGAETRTASRLSRKSPPSAVSFQVTLMFSHVQLDLGLQIMFSVRAMFIVYSPSSEHV
jgi:hypothetical protein